jgi:hypothetical protein
MYILQLSSLHRERNKKGNGKAIFPFTWAGERQPSSSSPSNQCGLEIVRPW